MKIHYNFFSRIIVDIIERCFQLNNANIQFNFKKPKVADLKKCQNK